MNIPKTYRMTPKHLKILKQLSILSGRSQTDLIKEAINDLFKKYKEDLNDDNWS